jgi:pyridoxine kinase
MKPVFVISSFVAGSNVGGSLAMKVLPAFGLDVSLLPTTLLGRHPGWGAPGGGAVPDALFSGMADGLAANGIPASADIVLTGYFASAAQVSLAAKIIREQVRKDSVVIVDTILGDFGKGLYVKEEVAAAMVEELLPLASLVKGNAWEFWETERRCGYVNGLPDRPGHVETLTGHLRHLPHRPARWVVTSAERDNSIGVFGFEGSQTASAGVPKRAAGGLPNGMGDFITLLLAACPCAALHDQLASVMRSLPDLLDSQITDQLTELNLAALSAIASLLTAEPGE